ncbi:MAG: hypothetical protein KAR45_03390 [Desulfobacteraceae bacterium]|nr:hypothetical protein [Desulfobacteraceae bacterium]
MKTNQLISLGFLFVFIIVCTIGCTTAGSKFIKLRYLGQNKVSKNLNVGIVPFLDKRGNLEKGYIGKRMLNSGKEEVYFVDGLNVAETLTQTFESYFKETGYNISRIETWEHTVEELKNIEKKYKDNNYKYILAGDIIEFEFFASKDFGTSMVLDIKLIVYLGKLENGVLTTIPVNLNLKRNDLKFSKQKIERFINESVTEVILRAMKL